MALVEQQFVEGQDPRFRDQDSSDQSLLEHFRFDPGDYQLVTPEIQRGVVAAMGHEEDVTYFGSKVPVHEVIVVDPYTSSDPVGYGLITEHVERMEDCIRARGYNPLEERSERYPYGVDRASARRGNIFTKAWLHQDTLDSLSAWHSWVPNAPALDYLINPNEGNLITSKKTGEEHFSSVETAMYLRYVEDAVGIRNRAVAMQNIAEASIRRILSERINSNGISWLSLASGTAEPSLQAVKQIQEVDGVEIDLTVADIDEDSLSMVQKHIKRLGLNPGNTTTWHQDITVGNLPQIAGRRFTLVENDGFEEYLPERDLGDGLGGDELGFYRGRDLSLPNASDFTRTAWQMVEPGGVLISGNMILDRPQLGFVFGIVDWPIINARSEESILRVYKRAGILDDPNAKITMYRIKDSVNGSHVYNIVAVEKAPIEEQAA